MLKTMIETEFLVVGAGMTGLSFAACVGDRDYLVVESDSHMGGYCKTVRRNGFVWDYSGHFFHFKHEHIERELVSRMACPVRRVERRSHVEWEGDWLDFPFQKNIHQLPQADFIRCLTDLYFRERVEHPSDFQEMLYGKYGRGICDAFLVPYNEKLYATDLKTLDVNAMGRFFPHVEFEDVMRNMRQRETTGYNATFTYPEGGAIEYVNAVYGRLDPNRVLLDRALTSVDVKARVAETVSGPIRFEHLVSSAPFPHLLRFCGEEPDPEVYSWNKVLVFNLGFDAKGPPDAHWVYYPQRELCFYRVGFYDNIFGSDRMSLYVELGFPSHAALSEHEIEFWRRRVLEDLQKVRVLRDQKLVDHHHVVLDPAYVHITRDSLRDVEEKKKQLASQGVHSVGRYGSWTYCSIEDNILEAQALASTLL